MLAPYLNTGQLITFYYVAKEKSFSVAAEQLCLTQSAVTQQINALERTSGVKLIHVRRKKVCLTETGSFIFKYAEEIYKQVRNVEAFFRETKESSLRIGVSTMFSSIIATVAIEFMSCYPTTKLSLQNGATYVIVNQLLDLQHQIAIVADLNCKNDRLNVIKISDREELVLVCNCSTPIPETKRLRLADLCDYQFLLPPEGSVIREILLKKFEAEGLEMSKWIYLQANYLECTKRFAEKKRGIVLLPLVEVKEEVAQGKLKILRLMEDITVGVNVLFPTDVPLSSVAEEFIDLVKKAFRG
jgi:DNA-binding transcriptional LysR family regulator